MRTLLAVAVCALLVATRLHAGDPAPTQWITPDGNTYHTPISTNDPFPDAVYGADHGGASLTLTYPYSSRFGFTDHSRGQFVYSVPPFWPRGSEGVFGMDVWLEQQDATGSWSPAALNGGFSDTGWPYQPINTPNPGPSPSYTFTWTYDQTSLPPFTNFRVFVYVYIYNQGGGSQGDYPIESSTATVNTGPANDPPRISWTSPFGTVNPTQVIAGQSYVISADAQDDNGNLVAVDINKNNQPFAYASGGDGYSGNSQNPSTDPPGVVTYTAWAVDAAGAQSATITETVTITGKLSQSPASSTDATLPFYSSPFTPSFSGGSGTGGWQFCIGGRTNWDGGASAYVGTNLGPSPGNSPAAVWVPNWTPPVPGNFQFWVARDGDGTFNPSNLAGPYTLTVTPRSPVGAFDAISPLTASAGDTINGSGWAADAQSGAPLSSVQIQVDGGAGGTFNATLGSSRPDVQSANLSWGGWSPLDITASGWSFSWTVPILATGTHTFTAIATDSLYAVAATLGAQSFTVTSPPGNPSNPTPGRPGNPGSNPGPTPTPSPSPTNPTTPGPTPSTVRVRYLGGPSYLWIDPQDLVQSPWPPIANPQPITPSSANVTLPAIP